MTEQKAPDPMEAMATHNARVTLQDLQAEITKARSQLDALQAQIAKERAAWEEELAGLRAERQRLHDEPPPSEEEPDDGEPHPAAPTAAPRHIPAQRHAPKARPHRRR